MEFFFWRVCRRIITFPYLYEDASVYSSSVRHIGGSSATVSLLWKASSSCQISAWHSSVLQLSVCLLQNEFLPLGGAFTNFQDNVNLLFHTEFDRRLLNKSYSYQLCNVLIFLLIFCIQLMYITKTIIMRWAMLWYVLIMF